LTRIEAIISPHNLDLLRETLEALGLSALSTGEVKGHLGPARQGDSFRGAPLQHGLLPAIKVEVVVPTPFVPRVLDAISRAARGGALDGTLFASPVLEAVRIRTGERGEGAL